MNGREAMLEASENVSASYVEDEANAWENSPFRWIKFIPSSRRRGAAAEKLAEAWLKLQGFDVRSTGRSDADRFVNGSSVEIKMSTPWSGVSYRFQQIRDQNYDYVLFLGLSPDHAHVWFVPKKVLMERPDGVGGQHGGSSASDTAWLAFDPLEPPRWLKHWGGTADEGIEVIRRELS